VRKGGVVIANGHDSNVRKVIKEYGNANDVRIETFGFESDCDFSAQNLELEDGLYSFDMHYHGKLLGPMRISLPGRHNILNALATAAMAINAGIDSRKVLDSLSDFTGIDRRLMLKEKINGITVIDDYAHHPTEIKASLEAIRQRFEPARLWCVFQPHQHSRTRFLLDDFAESFKLADTTIVPQIYFVRDSEAERKDINSQALVERISQKDTNAVFIESFGAISDYLVQNVNSGDVVVTMGAGDIWKVADEYIQRLRVNS
ncbi:unnamed protein product, partial [marine sediment metagenome]